MNIGLSNQPRSGATLRVWQVADDITRESGRLAQRGEVIERIEAEGGNRNTASTQYYYWKAARSAEPGRDGESGRDVGSTRIRVDSDGRLTLPRHFLQALRLDKEGS